MKKRLIIPLTLLLLLMQAAPAWAAVNLSINGKSYVPVVQPQVQQGVTVVSLDLIERVLGADTDVAGQTITIKKGADTLIMNLGSTAGTFNGGTVTLPVQPAFCNDIIMVPMRFVLERFGASVTWQAESQTIDINYIEKRQDMTAVEMLAKSNEVMQAVNTYKAKADITAYTNSVISGDSGENLNTNFKMNMQMLMAVQAEPIVMYAKAISTVEPMNAGLENEAVEIEILMNESGMYMKMPDIGWVKYNMPGMDMEAIMKQSGSQDPLSSLQQMKDYGAIINYADDQQKNGKNYWVIKVTMGPESTSKLLEETMSKMPQQELQDDSAMADIMNEIRKTLKFDIIYDVWIDQSNYQMAYMDLAVMMKYNVQLPADSEETTEPVSFSMNLIETAWYEIYDTGVAFSQPDVSKAIDFEQYLEEQAQSAEI